MRKPVVMGNWKLNGTKSTVTDLINDIVDDVSTWAITFTID